MRSTRLDRATVVALLAGLAICQAGRAGAATFTVNPTQVYLSAKATSVLLSLKNESSESLRFQLTLRSWDQKTTGEMSLAPTTDLVFFPQLLTLGPGEERKVRVGLRPGVTADATERTYRLFVEELPPSQSESPANGVRVLTKMGIPIFLQPATPAEKAFLEDVSAAKGRAAFVIRNGGNVHFVPEAVHVEGLSADGRTVFSLPVNAWYVLAGGLRRFDVDLPKEGCDQATAVVVTVRVGEAVLTQRIETPAGPCRP